MDGLILALIGAMSTRCSIARWWWLLALGLALPLRAQVVISEFMAANSKGLKDADGDTSDWIELHNLGTTAVNLQGWSLTDSTNLAPRWAIPATNLSANGYLVVFASGKNRAVVGLELHADFTLSAAGEYLALVNPEGEVSSDYAPAYPGQYSDTSYGLSNGRTYYFPQPTPGMPNGSGYENFVADTKFSVDRGFFTEPFEVEITTTTAGATIRYTTNGTMPQLTNGLVYSGPIHLAGTTVLRAAAFKSGYQSSDVDTQTYLFLSDVIRQSPTGQPPPGWPSTWGSNTRDYGMDPDVVNNPKFAPLIEGALKAIPTMSMVMDLADLFDSSRGIYANASQDGRTWERRCSLELMYPDGRKGFQTEAGVRIRGGYSRSTGNPKHAFRFFLREDYGAPELKYPLFGPSGQQSIDAFDLRCSQNYSWSFEGDSRCVHLRDQFSRDTQLAMGQDAERGDFYHLYINGQYWGLYNTCERPEASYGASYYGGTKEDYDVIKVAPDNSYTILATDGNLQAWTRLYNLCKAGLATDAAYEFIQGNNPDGTRNPAYERLLEVDNMIDYMLVIYYGGNLDAPISNFLGNTSPNNWYGMRNRLGSDGFRFYAHDSEHTLLNVSENRFGPYSAGDSTVTKSSPQWIFQKCMANIEFRQQVADRVQKFCFNNGVLTPGGATATFMKRKNEIDQAVIAESARWGDSKSGTPLTRDTWLGAVNTILNNYFPQRTTVLLGQLRSKNLYPATEAPILNPFGGAVQPNSSLAMSAPAGTIYFTLDGTDPRLRGGAVSPSAKSYSSSLTISESINVRARVRSGTNWSALVEAPFIVIQTYTNLQITEIMYHPAPEGAVEGDQFEFLELRNGENHEIDLSGVQITNAIHFTFPAGTHLAPGAFLVLAHSPTNFASRYPGVSIDGAYSGNLANGGERITIVHATGTPIVSANYQDAAPWPSTADGQGFSLVPRDGNSAAGPDDPTYWRASTRLGGSPGTSDPPPNLSGYAVVNEVLTHTDLPIVDAIELFNPGTNTVDLSGWYLTDSHAEPTKFRIPGGTQLGPGAFVVIDETQFNPVPGVDPSFTLSSHGEEVYLFSADAQGNLTGFSDGFHFDAAANGVSFGRYTNSVGTIQYPPQRQTSLGQANAGPWVGSVVINEIHYQPGAGEAEFVELKNTSDQSVPLYDPANPAHTWRLAGVGFDFPTNLVLRPHGLLLLVGGDPTVFRSRYGVPASVPVVGPIPGTLQDNGELLELQRPDSPDVDTNGVVTIPMIAVDVVHYRAHAPWPAGAAGLGSSLERINPTAWGDDPANWKASAGTPSPGLENDGNRPPAASAGLAQELQALVFPAETTLQGTASDDGLPKPPNQLQYSWRQVSGPARSLLLAPDQLTCKVQLPGLGAYVFELTVSDSELTKSSQVSISVGRPPAQSVLLPAGSRWKFWDQGSQPAGEWKSLNYNDSAWGSGPGPLGYGDGDEATVVSFGPNGGSKLTTTYFRTRLMVTNANSITGFTIAVQHDDGVVVYINQVEVYRDNLPEGEITFNSWANTAIGGTDESTYFEKEVDPSVLVEGANQIAVEIHQSSGSSTDISFDLTATAQLQIGSQALSVNAGPDQSITLPTLAQLTGSFSDDGLPLPPGVVTVHWSKVSGPGQVQFTDADVWQTSASFDLQGTYQLRLTATDGAIQVFDDMLVSVVAAPASVPQWEGVEFVGGTNPSVHLRFMAAANQAYQIEYQDDLSSASWQVLRQIPAGSNPSLIELTEGCSTSQLARFYRLVTVP
jgi:hypothetical protein